MPLNDTDYADPDVGDLVGPLVGDDERRFGEPEDDAIANPTDTDDSGESGPSQSMVDPAEHAWKLRVSEVDADELRSQPDAVITLQLLGKALLILGSASKLEPLEYFSRILRTEPALAPKVARYLIELGSSADHASRTAARVALDGLVTEPSFSAWQQMWSAEAVWQGTEVAGWSVTLRMAQLLRRVRGGAARGYVRCSLGQVERWESRRNCPVLGSCGPRVERARPMGNI